ncbi:hypothetical protein [Ramlibacter sp. WS9]|uniref:hypothetical protein n=1 Tax=Ramlibacter sp. WS9 TaxID=1882741 RepID=UPI0011413239|nr:hypothetical protein [Ramlibacter sp. WS9]
MSDSADVVAVLDSLGGRQDFEGASVWRVEGTSQRERQYKAAVLETICRTHRAYVRYEECPDGIDGTDQVEPHLWWLPVGVSGEAMLDWLYMGNWQLTVGASPPKTNPDLCRSPDADVAEYVRKSGVGVVIDSFHDDVSWVIGASRNAV